MVLPENKRKIPVITVELPSEKVSEMKEETSRKETSEVSEINMNETTGKLINLKMMVTEDEADQAVQPVSFDLELESRNAVCLVGLTNLKPEPSFEESSEVAPTEILYVSIDEVTEEDKNDVQQGEEFEVLRPSARNKILVTEEDEINGRLYTTPAPILNETIDMSREYSNFTQSGEFELNSSKESKETIRVFMDGNNSVELAKVPRRKKKKSAIRKKYPVYDRSPKKAQQLFLPPDDPFKNTRS